MEQMDHSFENFSVLFICQIKIEKRKNGMNFGSKMDLGGLIRFQKYRESVLFKGVVLVPSNGPRILF